MVQKHSLFSLILTLLTTFTVSTIRAQETPPPIAWQKTYEKAGYISSQNQDGYYATRQLSKTPSGGFVTVGEGFEVGSNFRGVILYDSLGNIIRERNYNEIPGNYSTLNNFIINKVTPLADGSFIAVGKTNVSNGIFTDITPIQGSHDAFVLKLDDTLGVEWLKRYGGPEADEFMDIIPVAGGGYLAVGATSGEGGDVTLKRDTGYVWYQPYVGPIAQMPTQDWWVVKLDNAGNILQDKCFGSNQPYDALAFAEIPSGVLQLSGGDFIITGISNGSDLDITNPIPFQLPGNTSFWIIRINSNMDIVWNKSIGGSAWEQIGNTILEMPDGNIVIGGRSSSIDGDMDGLGNGGGQYVFDIYVAKLDVNDGNILWGNCYGTGGDDFLAVNTAPYAQTRLAANGITKTSDGNLAFVATANGAGSTGNPLLAGNDVWVVKVNAANGTILWDKAYGGSAAEGGYSIIANDDGSYIVYGHTNSTDGDLHGQRYPQNHLLADIWMFKLAPCDDSLTIHREICAGDTFDFNGTPLTQSGIYYDTTGNQYCSFYETLYLTVRPAFTPAITSASDNVVVAETGYHSYFWLLNGTPLSATQEEVTADGSGEYALIVTDSLGCASDTANYSFIYTGCAAPAAYWAKSYGGTGNDQALSVTALADGYLIAGQTNSANGDVTGLHGTANDFWIVKINENGDTLWTKTLGGNGADAANSIRATADGGFVVAGTSATNATIGDVTAPRPVTGSGTDIWVIKFDANGNEEWQHLYGGNGNESVNSIEEAPGGYILAGNVPNATNTGTFAGTTSNGGVDAWILKLNTNGTVDWLQRLGAGGGDYLYSVQPTTDGGYVAAGYSAYNANAGTLGATARPIPAGGGNDVWVIKLDATGNTQWQKLYGGSGADIAYAVRQAADGGYIVSGYAAATSTDGTLDGIAKPGGNDFWILKLDASGDLQWQKAVGGTASDQATAYEIVVETDGYVFAGLSASADGDVTNNNGGNDFWSVKTDLNGDVLWQKSIGGATNDQANSIAAANGGGYVVAGVAGNNSNLSDAKGGNDFYIVKLDGYHSCTTPVADTICNGEEYDFSGAILTTEGVYFDTVIVNGIYNITALRLTVNTVFTTPIEATICPGESYVFAGLELTEAGTYSDTLQSVITGCDSIKVLTLDINVLPVPTVTNNGAVLSTGIFDSYQWYFNGTIISGATAQTYTATQDGAYHVVVTDAEGCEGESAVYNHSTVGLADNPFNKLAIYPNPTTGNIMIDFDAQAAYTLTDITGKVIEQSDLNGSITVVDVSGLNAGTYLITITSQSGETTVKKIVKK